MGGPAGAGAQMGVVGPPLGLGPKPLPTPLHPTPPRPRRNSESITYFWQNWNIPVHKWCLRWVCTWG